MKNKDIGKTIPSANNHRDDGLLKDLYKFFQRHITSKNFNIEDFYSTLMESLEFDPKDKFIKSFTVKEFVGKITENSVQSSPNKITKRILQDEDGIMNIYNKHKPPIDLQCGTENLLTELIYYCISKNVCKLAPHYSNHQLKSSEATKGRENDAKALRDLLKAHHKVIVSGELGSGKSHFIKYCLKTWGTKDYGYINYDNQNDLNTNLHQIKFIDRWNYTYYGSAYDLMSNCLTSSLLIIDDMNFSQKMSDELKWLSKLNMDIIILTASPIKNEFFQLYELSNLTDDILIQIFTAESRLSIPDKSLLKSLLTLTMHSPLMVSLIARQCKSKIKDFPDESHPYILKSVLEPLEYPDNHLGNENANYLYKHGSTGYNKSLNILGHIKSIYVQSFEYVDPTLRRYMKWLSCFGCAPLPLEFIPYIIRDYSMECLEELHNIGLITLAEDSLQLSSLISRAAFAVENPSPNEEDLKDLPDSLLDFLKNYDVSLSVPYLSNSLLTFIQALYKRMPYITNRKGQMHTSKKFEKWQTLIYLVYFYYNQNGDFFMADKLISTIRYPSDLITDHHFLDADFFQVGNNMHLIFDREEMVAQLDKLDSKISQFYNSIGNTDSSYLLINALDHIVNLFCWMAYFNLASNGHDDFKKYQCLLISSMDKLLTYSISFKKDAKICISDDAIKYYRYILYIANSCPSTLFDINLTVIKEWENRNYRIRGLAFILLMQNFCIHQLSKYEKNYVRFFPCPLASYICEVKYLSCQIRECKLIPHETLLLCVFLYISTASIQNILNSLGVKIQNIPILNSLEELLSRSYLPKDEMDRIIKRWEVFLSYFK